ncbi:MAG: cytochrome ubiquinol oxidase subunit I [Opitutales bacterium]|nr:cytochrome ubiquinol oxidase subunit I [Opitutales bacterium]
MEVEFLSRALFALTAAFHFLFPPVSIGFALYIFIVEALWVARRDEKYLRAAKFFLRLFGLLFAVGAATGIVMVFQFGTNWPAYSNFVGDVFGSPLAIEAVAAFFLESTFLAVSLWGWEKVGRKTHLLSTFLVCLGAHLSAVWILAANSFMQTPSGFRIFKNGEMMPENFAPASEAVAECSAKIQDFWGMVFSPSFFDRFTHTIAASWAAGGFFAMGVCAYFILRRRDLDVFKAPAKIAAVFAFAACLAVLQTGHSSAKTVALTQPEKFAAFEAHYKTQKNAPLCVLGWACGDGCEPRGIMAKSLLSILAHGSPDAEVKGLEDLPSDEFLLKLHPNATAEELAQIRPNYWPPVNPAFQAFHFMSYLGGAMLCVSFLSLVLLYRDRFFDVQKFVPRVLQKVLMWSALLPILASQLGWATAEIGRQPWIVWHVLKTKDAVTTSACAGEILFSIILFALLFIAIVCVFFFVLARKMRGGLDGKASYGN